MVPRRGKIFLVRKPKTPEVSMFKFLAAAVALSASTAFALPVEVSRPLERMNFEKSMFKTYDFEAIVKLSNCSGALITFDGMPDTKKAVVMTNGHCADLPNGRFLEAGEVLWNKPVSRKVGLLDSKMKINVVKATKFIFATMTDTDVSLYELELTYKQIKDKFDIDPLLLSPSHPKNNTETLIISGYWEKGWDCSINGFVPKLREDAYTWIDSIRYNPECDTTHGTSGSPIIERNTRTVIGINNTGNDSGEECTMDNPCEVNTDGTITVTQGTSYGQETYQIYSCLTKDYTLDLNQAGCKLPKPKRK
jgi:V8-like Glu-specific endopeptidase